MDRVTKVKLDEANKLIFVKKYSDAEVILNDLAKAKETSRNLIIHLRRIELATMLKTLPKLHEEYLREKGMEGRVCLALVEQHGEMCSAAESIARYQEIIRDHGPSAVAYFGIAYGMENQGNLDRAIYNYEQSLTIDPDWYPSYFGLSQVYYHKGDEKKGDHYFYLFEQASPYNVYGNFETHRKLAAEFGDRGMFTEAEAAVTALSTWWTENRGHCPIEITIYEHLAVSKIAQQKGDQAQAMSQKSRAKVYAEQALHDTKTREGALYFVARLLEEHGEVALAFDYYKRILRQEGSNPSLVQKIGSQFLSSGEFQLARELFEQAYDVHPDNSDIRFCLLVSKLKLAKVNVEEYLIGRERLRQLIESGDRVELLALLHSLMAKFQEDPDVQGYIADVYLRLGNNDRAGRHFAAMYQLDSKYRRTALRYASFLMQHDNPEKAREILDKITGPSKNREEHAEVLWLRASYHARRQEYAESMNLLRLVLQLDPWNISYLVQEIINLTHISKIEDPTRRIEEFLPELGNTDDSKVDWSEFDRNTDQFLNEHAYELSYVRSKLRFLYTNGEEEALRRLVVHGGKFNPGIGTYDLMRLLNTNFDSPWIYWALGILFKDLWQLETATMWLEQVMLNDDVGPALRGKVLLELADCYTWQNRQLPKAIEFAKLSLDLGDRANSNQAMTVLAHAYLRSGKIREANIYLEQAGADGDAEARYLKGLVLYRNGARKEANKEWKPLLTTRTENLRFHNIKQDILKYYFEGQPYNFKVN
jgi:tetratricopeptide (TPR) repeat protein